MTSPQHSQRLHARFQPSQAYRWAGYLGEPGCPGSVNLCAQYPEQAGPAALEGTMAHELLEECLTLGIDPFQHTLRSLYPTEMLEGVQHATHWFAQKRREFPKAKFQFETRVHITPEFHGTFDGSIWDSETKQLFIVDFKYGRQPVIAKNNPQLMSYAVGALDLSIERAEAEGIWLVVIQPRRYDNGEIVQETQLLPTNFNIWQAQTMQAIVDADAQPPIYRPGPQRCRYCPGAISCPAIAPSLPISAGGVSEVPLQVSKPKRQGKKEAPNGPVPFAQPTLSLNGESIAPRDVPAYVLERVAAALTGLPAVKAYVKQVEEMAEMLALDFDIELPGFKVVNAEPRIAWSAPEEQIVRFMESLNIPRDAVVEEKLISITSAKTLLKKNMDNGATGWETNKTTVWDRFAQLTARAPNDKRELVPIGDPRPSVKEQHRDIFSRVDLT